MPDPTIPVAVSELQALHVELLTAASELDSAQRELTRLKEEEFQFVRFEVSRHAAGRLKATALEVQKWLRGAPPEATGR